MERKILDVIYEIISLRENKKVEVLTNDIIFTLEELKKTVYLQATLSESFIRRCLLTSKRFKMMIYFQMARWLRAAHEFCTAFTRWLELSPFGGRTAMSLSRRDGSTTKN